jgi:hypothetical protein
MPVQIENLIRGLSTGVFPGEIGSRFGSSLFFDGLIVPEPTPENCPWLWHGFQGCNGEKVEWFGRKWSVMLGYREGLLVCGTVYTRQEQGICAASLSWLKAVLGQPWQPRQSDLEFVWVLRRGMVWLTTAGGPLEVFAIKFTREQRVLVAVERFLWRITGWQCFEPNWKNCAWLFSDYDDV